MPRERDLTKDRRDAQILVQLFRQKNTWTLAELKQHINNPPAVLRRFGVIAHLGRAGIFVQPKNRWTRFEATVLDPPGGRAPTKAQAESNKKPEIQGKMRLELDRVQLQYSPGNSPFSGVELFGPPKDLLIKITVKNGTELCFGPDQLEAAAKSFLEIVKEAHDIAAREGTEVVTGLTGALLANTLGIGQHGLATQGIDKELPGWCADHNDGTPVDYTSCEDCSGCASLPGAVVAFLRQEKKIQAIKALRTIHDDLGLVEAKRTIEEWLECWEDRWHWLEDCF